MSLTSFFDEWSIDYDAAIERCVPRYREMLWALIHYIPEDCAPRRIVELGPGSGNLSALLARRFPAAELHLVDLSAEMLERTRSKLGDSKAVHLHERDFATVDFEPASIDLVMSSISIHHLDDEAKQRLFARVHAWLGPTGLLLYSDQFAGEAEHYSKNIASWHRSAREKGASEAEWQSWMRHQDEHDHHASLPDQIAWLRTAGFATVDCVWRHLLWTVLYCKAR